MGYCRAEPQYDDIDVGPEYCESLMINGQLLIRKGGCRLAITFDSNMNLDYYMLVEGVATRRKELQEFIEGILLFGTIPHKTISGFIQVEPQLFPVHNDF